MSIRKESLGIDPESGAEKFEVYDGDTLIGYDLSYADTDV
jgi:hypothetical protein